MARGIAKCTCAICGAKFTRIKRDCRNSTAAAEWAEWAAENITECDNCYHARKERERAEADVATAKEMAATGMPELTGSEKQVAWAKKIRQICYKSVTKDIADDEEDVEPEVVEEEKTFLRFLLTHSDAHWWIDNRENLQGMYITDIMDAFEWEFAAWMKVPMESTAESPEEAELRELRKAAEEEMVAAPKDQTHSGVVEITVISTAVSARYEKNEAFHGIVKRLGYAWDSKRRAWTKAINFTTGTAQERAAELGSNLLNTGFAVQIADPDTRTAAIEGRYQPEHCRWILAYTKGELKGMLAVVLPGRGDGMYDKAKQICGSFYDAPCYMAVPAKSWAEVLDFAKMNDYKITPAAQKIIDTAKAAVITVTPAPIRAAKYHEIDPASIMANGAADIPANLLDED